MTKTERECKKGSRRQRTEGERHARGTDSESEDPAETVNPHYSCSCEKKLVHGGGGKEMLF